MFILDALAKYKPVNTREAESICERVVPRLTHANAAVVISTVKVRPIFSEASAHTDGPAVDSLASLSPTAEQSRRAPRPFCA